MGNCFEPDARNLRHQRHCAKPACRKASKAASQRRWLAKAENRDYFRGAINVARVQAWRAAHPGYWRRPGVKPATALQDDSSAQGIETHSDSDLFAPAALQEVLAAQPTVLIGLIAHLTDSALQEDIAKASRRLLQLGHDILQGRAGHDDQARAGRRSGCAGFRRSSVGSITAWCAIDTSSAVMRPACALYLFLVTVADAPGLSYYSEASIARRLSMDPARLAQARADLMRLSLIAYESPLYQVLALDAPALPLCQRPRTNSRASSGASASRSCAHTWARHDDRLRDLLQDSRSP